jgi:hypothetical protein
MHARCHRFGESPVRLGWIPPAGSIVPLLPHSRGAGHVHVSSRAHEALSIRREAPSSATALELALEGAARRGTRTGFPPGRVGWPRLRSRSRPLRRASMSMPERLSAAMAAQPRPCARSRRGSNWPSRGMSCTLLPAHTARYRPCVTAPKPRASGWSRIVLAPQSCKPTAPVCATPIPITPTRAW